MRSTHDEVDVDAVVTRRRDAADGVVELTFARADGAPMPAWTPGSHVDVHGPDGLVRQYSLTGDPADLSTWRVGVLREPLSRGGSEWVHAHLHEGSAVRLRGPRNQFPLEEADGYTFVAGGIGITPIAPMIAAAQLAGRPWRFVYGGRTRASMAFLPELTAAYGEKVEVSPQDEAGLLDVAGIVAALGPGDLLYACGPEPLLLALEAACDAAGSAALRVERFAPKAQAEHDPDHAFDVVLARSGKRLTVAADRSILQTVEDEGIFVLSSCREGTCGTCETVLLEGRADHRDSLLSKAEQEANDTIFICCSRALDPELTLDL